MPGNCQNGGLLVSVGEGHMGNTFDGWERCCRRRAWAHRVHEERIAIDRREVFAEASQSVTPEVK